MRVRTARTGSLNKYRDRLLCEILDKVLLFKRHFAVEAIVGDEQFDLVLAQNAMSPPHRRG